MKVGVSLIALLVGLAFALVAAQPASAGVPPICEEYPDLPQCEEPGGGGGGDDDDGDDDGDGEGPAGGGGPSGDADGAGNLPFTGYPLTPLLMLVLLLLLSALAIRAYTAIREQVTTGSRRGPPSTQ